MRVTVVYGAPTPPGRLSSAVERVAERLAAFEDANVARIDLHREPLAPMRTDWQTELDPRNVEAIAKIDTADGVVFGSPVYRASLPGVLKNLIDHLSVESLRGKPVGLVVVGARPHHYLGVDRHMRDILSWFGAIPLPTSVYLTHADFADGDLGGAARGALDDLARTMVRMTKLAHDLEPGPAPLAASATE